MLDIGGGDSRLVDYLLQQQIRCVSVLDVSAAALARAQARIGPRSEEVTWIEADVTGEWTAPPVDIWHDRGVFHFLTGAEDRGCYLRHLRDTLRRGGSAIIATFALDGPEKCSGLPVARYSPESLAAELGVGLRLIESVPHVHRTPWGTAQSFQYSRFMRIH